MLNDNLMSDIWVDFDMKQDTNLLVIYYELQNVTKWCTTLSLHNIVLVWCKWNSIVNRGHFMVVHGEMTQWEYDCHRHYNYDWLRLIKVHPFYNNYSMTIIVEW